MGDPSIKQTQIHAIKGIKDNYIRNFKQNNQLLLPLEVTN